MNSGFERKNNFPQQQNMGGSGNSNSGNDMFSRRGQNAGGPNRNQNQNSGFGGNDGGNNFGGNNFNQGMNR